MTQLSQSSVGPAHWALMLEGMSRALRRVSQALQERHHRAVSRRELRCMDEYTLRDLGLSHRAAVERPRVRAESTLMSDAQREDTRWIDEVRVDAIAPGGSAMHEALVPLAAAVAAVASAIFIILSPPHAASSSRASQTCAASLATPSAGDLIARR
jgi:hypothetical protein